MFRIRNALHKANLSPKNCTNIYDTLVRPINTYGSEIWGTFLGNICAIFDNNSEKYKLCDDQCFEKTELEVLKSILGVHRRVSNAAFRGELGRYPGVIHLIQQVLKNWIRIAIYDKNSLLYDIYLICNLSMSYQKTTCWLLISKDTLGLCHLWDNQGHKSNFTGLILKAVSSLKSIFEFQWRNELNRFPDPLTWQ